ncbi:pseudouridine synthase [Dellaglioa sp. P0083]|uniref:pseudouridine synthase n=1 Tax=Dellaglioa kimchii TaxID=3344667 RepID=UPI0038D4CF20
MRIDKFLTEMQFGTRSDVRKIIKQKKVIVDGELITSIKLQVSPSKSVIQVDGDVIHYQKYYYYLLNKPAGVLTATKDRKQKTVMDLFNSVDYRDDLFPVGRLDKDTTGLLLITNDGQLGHQMLSPKQHIDKVYFAKVDGQVTTDDVIKFETGLLLKDGMQTKPAKLIVESYNSDSNISEVLITITEGKYHQIKRMFGAIGMKVIRLERKKMATLELEPTLSLGRYRALTDEEIESIK